MRERNYRIHDANAGLSVSYKARAETNPERHMHDVYELLYIESGERTFFHANRTFHIGSGSFLCVRPGVMHRALNRPHETCSLICAYFDGKSPFSRDMLTLLDSCGTSEEPVVTVPESDRPAFIASLHRVADELNGKNAGYRSMAWAYLYQAVAGLVRQLVPGADDQPVVPMNPNVMLVIEYLSRHFREDISLSSVAFRFRLSASYLSRLFRSSTRYTFVEYLQSLRIREACRLLTSTNDTVGSIASRSGFGSVTQFGRVFLKSTGETPYNWRKHALSAL
jgi:AraC-like DNA-binding protein/mannose-6-phosphate isomerase-like protein (cupin superfamily)